MTNALLPTRLELFRSLYSVQDAVFRWIERRAAGLTDDELRNAIAYEFGIAGGTNVSGRFISYKGGADPAVWFDEWSDDAAEPAAVYEQPTRTRHAVKGKALLTAVRNVLRISVPVRPGMNQHLF